MPTSTLTKEHAAEISLPELHETDAPGAHLSAALCNSGHGIQDPGRLVERIGSIGAVKRVWAFPLVGTLLIRHEHPLTRSGILGDLLDVFSGDPDWELRGLW